MGQAAEKVMAILKRLVIRNKAKSCKCYGDFEVMPILMALTAI